MKKVRKQIIDVFQFSACNRIKCSCFEQVKKQQKVSLHDVYFYRDCFATTLIKPSTGLHVHEKVTDPRYPPLL
jgi:uncharacterized Fe-S cluster-containing protein